MRINVYISIEITSNNSTCHTVYFQRLVQSWQMWLGSLHTAVVLLGKGSHKSFIFFSFFLLFSTNSSIGLFFNCKCQSGVLTVNGVRDRRIGVTHKMIR